MEDKEAMENLTRINLTLSHILAKSQEKIWVLSKKLKRLQAQTKTKTPSTKITSLDKKPSMINRSATAGLMGEPVDWTIKAKPAISPINDTN